MRGSRVILLDRDGTIIVERNYLSDPDQVELVPGAASGLRRLSECGLRLVVITNQSAIGRGMFDPERLDQIHARLRDLLETEGVQLSGIYSCPHTPQDNCHCRKPRSGLVELAAEELDFDPKAALMIGDKTCDIEVGRRVGATTFLVRTGYGVKTEAEIKIAPDYIVDDLDAAAQVAQRLIRERVMVDEVTS